MSASESGHESDAAGSVVSEGASIAASESSTRGDKIHEIVRYLREKLPVDGMAPEEDWRNVNTQETSEDEITTTGYDSFLYTKEELVEMHHVPQYYCKGCHETKHEIYCLSCKTDEHMWTRSFIFFSLTTDQLRTIYRDALGDLTGKTLYDIGSRTGNVLYMGYLYSNAKKLIGVELSSYFAQLSSRTVKKFGMDDRIEIIESDFVEKPEVMQKANVVTMFNPFGFQFKVAEQQRYLRFLRKNLKPGTVLLVVPSMKEVYEHAKMPVGQVKKWLTRTYTNKELEISVYKVHKSK